MKHDTNPLMSELHVRYYNCHFCAPERILFGQNPPEKKLDTAEFNCAKRAVFLRLAYT